jgi:hypothetical protein
MKLTTIVVKVKKKFIPACGHFLYCIRNSGKEFSISQKMVMPPTRIRLLCEDGIVLK